MIMGCRKHYFCKVSDKLINWCLLLLLSIIWGGSFILMKKGMFTDNGAPVFSSMQVGSMRMFIAGSLLLPIGIMPLLRLKSIRDFLSLSMVGFCGNFIPAFLFTYAETGIPSGLAGVLNSCTPLFIVFLGIVFFKTSYSWFQFAGILIGTLGLFILLRGSLSIGTQTHWTHPGAVVLATLLYAISLSTIKYRLQHLNSIQITSMAFSILWIPSLLALLLSDPFQNMGTSQGLSSLKSIGILSVFGTVAAVFLFNIVIRRSSAIFASSVTYFIPMVALIFGSLSGEKIVTSQLLGMAIIISGVLLINVFQKKDALQKE